MTSSVADFAETYSKMSDDELSRVLSDEYSLVPEAVEALHAELKRRPQTPPTIATVEPQHDPLTGIHGWLFWWCFGSIVGAILQLHNAPTANPASLLSLVFFVLFYAVLALNVTTGICVACLASFALRLVFINFITLFIAFALVMVVGVLTALVSPEQGGELIGGALVAIVPVAIWFWYFKVSIRVRNTFGRNM
jgi:hypothetical protein